MTKRLFTPTLLLLAAACAGTDPSVGSPGPIPVDFEASFDIEAASVVFDDQLDAFVFEARARADVASYVPSPAGQVDGAPVVGYVFTTTLPPLAVGFSDVEGTLALAVTSHPDFDDTPLWDEDQNEAYDDDGAVYHAHWVVLVEDQRAPAGLAVAQSPSGLGLPPTAPMPIYLDSPGFTVIERDRVLSVVVPADRIRRAADFEFQALSAFMRVDASGETPLLAVHALLSAPGPLTATAGAPVPASAWPAPADVEDSLQIVSAQGRYLPAVDSFVMSMETVADAALVVPPAAGQVDGAPVLGYVFPTSLSPSAAGFKGVDDGTLVLAVTSHPDFDDTPLWDEDLDRDFGNDGAIYHVHWAVLTPDESAGAGLSVKSESDSSRLPPTAPMPMYLDSPGYHAFARGSRLYVVVPAWHIGSPSEFAFDGLTARMRVDASGPGPVLKVEEIIDLVDDELNLELKTELAP